MRDWETLGRRGELGRLRDLGSVALERFGVHPNRLTVLRHEHNTTFRVDAGHARYVLRLGRSGAHDARTVDSEMAWLRALRADTDLGVPDPVPARDGALVVQADATGVPEPRLCVLMRWQEGRLVDRRLAPRHLGAVGVLMADLQEHARRWTPPPAFIRPRLDTLTAGARRSSACSAKEAADASGPWPSRTDGTRAASLVRKLFGEADASLIGRALHGVRRTTRTLAGREGGIGLIHGDLHYENVLFRGGEALAIDFDDCGWGPALYDLAVMLSELEDRPGYPALRDALLDGYARLRSLPPDHEEHLRALVVLRRVQLVMWIIESRQQAAFRDDWRPWARKELDGLTRAVDG